MKEHPRNCSSEINVSTCPRHPDTMNRKIPGNHQAAAAQLHRFSLPAGLAGPLPLRMLWLSGSLIIPVLIIAMLVLPAFQRGYLAQGVPLWLQSTGLYLMNDYSVFNVRERIFISPFTYYHRESLRINLKSKIFSAIKIADHI